MAILGSVDTWLICENAHQWCNVRMMSGPGKAMEEGMCPTCDVYL